MVQRGLVVAAPGSGCGKTVLTLALLRALKNRNIDVRSAKAGPDYIDPGFHAAALGRPSVNLDPWAMSRQRLQDLACNQGGSHLLIEAMMGLYDGAADAKGSGADLAAILDVPVVLVIDTARQSHSVAALACGFRDYRPELKLAGVILNKTGGARHELMLRNALLGVGVEVFGAIARNDALGMPARHLGLVQANEHPDIEAFVEAAAKIIANELDLERMLSLFEPVAGAAGTQQRLPAPGNRIAIACDTAFSFIYPHVLDDWRAQGAELILFSPLADEAPDAGADAVYLPGGYPELHAGRIAAADKFRQGLHRAKQRGALVYGECGGYMVLGDGLADSDGKRHAMTGLLWLETSFAKRQLHLGYRRVQAEPGFVFGEHLACHEFHYSVATSEKGNPLFNASDALGGKPGPQGLRAGNVMGSYLHLIDAGDPV